MTDVIYAPPHPEAAAITQFPVPETPEARALIDRMNQNNQELARAQTESVEAIGKDLTENDGRVRAIRAELDGYAGEIAALDSQLTAVNAKLIAKAVADNQPGEIAGDPRNDAEWGQAEQSFWRFGGGRLTNDQAILLAKGNKFQQVMEDSTIDQVLDPNFDPIAAVSAGSLSTTFGPGAGVWARPQYDTEITKLLVEKSPIREFARVTNINGAEFVGVVRNANRDTIEQVREGNSGTQQVQTDRYDERRVRPYIFNARPALTDEMIEDSAINLENEVRLDVSDDFAVDEANLFTVGSGAQEPLGFAADTDVLGITSETSAVISQKDLLDLALALRPKYRTAAAAAYAFSTTAFRSAILDEDGQGRRLWQPSVSAGFPSLYNGWRYWESIDLATVAASSKSVFFADWFSFYRIVDRRGTKIVRDEITSPGNVILNHRRRTGGKTWKTEAGKALITKA